MKTMQSEFEKGQVSVGMKFEHEGRSWEVLQLNVSGFNAKTTDNQLPKHAMTAEFKYKQ